MPTERPAPGLRYAAVLLPRSGGPLPSTELVLPGVTADPDRLAAYSRVCGFRLTGALPATYPHVLAFPLVLRLMLDRAFPFPALGLVHLANRIHRARPLGDGPEPHVVWELPADLGRRYAAVSGDRNPIHLYRLTAWLFGFRRPIAHGMWAAARC